jgi:hypothetical protein
LIILGFIGTVHSSNRGDLIPPPPPAYLDLFPELPGLIEEEHTDSDATSNVDRVYQFSQLSDALRACEQSAVPDAITENTANVENLGTVKYVRFTVLIFRSF